jgi:phage shock protein E
VKLGDIEAGNFSQIPKDTPVNLYCRSGRRSAIAYNILNNAGYTNITDVGGMEQIQGVNITRN